MLIEKDAGKIAEFNARKMSQWQTSAGCIGSAARDDTEIRDRISALLDKSAAVEMALA